MAQPRQQRGAQAYADKPPAIIPGLVSHWVNEYVCAPAKTSRMVVLDRLRGGKGDRIVVGRIKVPPFGCPPHRDVQDGLYSAAWGTEAEVAKSSDRKVLPWDVRYWIRTI